MALGSALHRLSKQSYLAALPQGYQEPWWLTTGKAGLDLWGREAGRKMRGMGIRRTRRNWEQYKSTMLPILNKEWNERMGSLGNVKGSQYKRGLRKIRAPFDLHSNRIRSARNLQKRAASKQRIFDIINFLS